MWVSRATTSTGRRIGICRTRICMYITMTMCVRVLFHACIAMFVVIPFKNHHFFFASRASPKLYAYTYKIYTWCSSLRFFHSSVRIKKISATSPFLLSFLFLILFFSSTFSLLMALSSQMKREKKVYYILYISHFSSWHWLPEEFPLWKDAWKKWAMRCREKTTRVKKPTTKHKTSIVMSSLFSFCIRLVIFFFFSFPF